MSAQDLSVSMPGPTGRGHRLDVDGRGATHGAGLAVAPAVAPAPPPVAPTPPPAAPWAGTTASSPGPPSTPAAPSWCRVRVHGPHGAVDVALPTARTAGDLVAELAGRLLPGAPLADASWRLHRLGDRPLDPDAAFGAALPHDGEVFHLDAAPLAEPARVVDDALDALAGSAGRSGRWSATSLATATGTAAIAASTLLSLVLAVLTPRGVALPLLLAASLLAAALLMPREPGSGTEDDAPADRSPSRDVPRGVAAGAALPAWAAAGFAVAHLTGGGWSTGLALTGLGVAVGSVAAAVTVPSLVHVWSLPAASGLMAGIGGAMVGSGAVTDVRAAALLGTAALLLVATLPWMLTRAPRWSSPEPPEGGAAQLEEQAERTRATLTAVSVSAAASVAACSVVLAGSGGELARWLALALAMALALRARWSRFVLESGAMLAGGLLPLGLLAAGLVAGAGTGTGARTVLVLAVVAALAGSLALVSVTSRAADGHDGGLRRLGRARVRRTLDVAESLAAVAVLPLLLGVMGLYAAAADAGASL